VPAAIVHRISIFPLSIPLRGQVTHAASRRIVADPVIAAVELTNGIVGYGETLPRPYVTQETVESVVRAIQTTFIPAVIGFHAESFPEALEAIEALPWHDDEGRPVPAARAAIELALLDASLRAYHRDMDAVVQWMGLPGFGTPGSIGRIRYSGVLASDELAATLRQLRLMYWYGLRHFKLKVGTPGDRERVERVCHYLRHPLANGRATLRIDANGAWSKECAIEWLSAIADLPISAVEQPLPRGHEEDLGTVRASFAHESSDSRPNGATECSQGWSEAKPLVGSSPPSPPRRGGGRELAPHAPTGCFQRADPVIIHDESLVTLDDAKRLIELGVADAFNIRISKCGGLIPSLRLAALARRHNVGIQLGCMVGETSILSTAGLRFLEVCPGVTWAEGCFGSFLLGADVVAKALRFGYAGRPPKLNEPGLGVTIDPIRLKRLCTSEPLIVNL